MRKLLLVSLALFTLSIGAQEVKSTTLEKEKKIASAKDQAKTLAKVKTKALTKELKLNNEQQRSVYNVFLEHFSEKLKTKQKLKQVTASEDKVTRDKLEKRLVEHKTESSKKLDNKLKSILTDEQHILYFKLKSKQEKIKKN